MPALLSAKSRRNFRELFEYNADKQPTVDLKCAMKTPRRLRKNMIEGHKISTPSAQHADGHRHVLRRRAVSAVTRDTEYESTDEPTLNHLYHEHADLPVLISRPIVPNRVLISTIEKNATLPKAANNWLRPITVSQTDDLGCLKRVTAKRSLSSHYQLKGSVRGRAALNQGSTTQVSLDIVISNGSADPLGAHGEGWPDDDTSRTGTTAAEGQRSIELAISEGVYSKRRSQSSNEKRSSYGADKSGLLTPPSAPRNDSLSSRSYHSTSSIRQAHIAQFKPVHAGAVKLVDLGSRDPKTAQTHVGVPVQMSSGVAAACETLHKATSKRCPSSASARMLEVMSRFRFDVLKRATQVQDDRRQRRLRKDSTPFLGHSMPEPVSPQHFHISSLLHSARYLEPREVAAIVAWANDVRPGDGFGEGLATRNEDADQP